MSVAPLGLMRMKAAPKGKFQVSPSELTHGRPLLRSDLLIDEETLQLLSYIMKLA